MKKERKDYKKIEIIKKTAKIKKEIKKDKKSEKKYKI